MPNPNPKFAYYAFWYFPNFLPIMLVLCFSEMHYTFILCFFFVQEHSSYDTMKREKCRVQQSS